MGLYCCLLYICCRETIWFPKQVIFLEPQFLLVQRQCGHCRDSILMLSIYHVGTQVCVLCFHHCDKIYDKYVVKQLKGWGHSAWLVVAKDILHPSWEGVVTRYLNMRESKKASHLSHLADKEERH